MPLAFQSRSHGVIAFGFFNIECDMLLLDRLFFFADRFSSAVAEISGRRTGGGVEAEASIPGWRIRDQRSVGNVNLAIQGRDLSGFIGATYRTFPFPQDPGGFKQKPDGEKNRASFEEMIRDFGEPEALSLRWEGEGRDEILSVAEYVFDLKNFADLVSYVDRGGYPRWKDERRPPYVKAMMKTLRESSSPLLAATL
jgi:hypothetical protein